ncbi:MAG: GNAT family N-acetyltransferase [Gammaproteobacteria bacterium]|nr:GNAT family N-acetyltransferase [Gammaproteobacteria bacterium]
MLESIGYRLRRLELKDLPKKVEWVNNKEINETLLFDYPISLSETEEWYKRTYFNRTRWDFVIEDIVSESVIGMTGLINVNMRHRNAQLFITIGERGYWNKGIAKKAIPDVLRFAFAELGLEKVYLYTLANNIKARALYEKVGFYQEALKSKEYFIHGKLNDLYHHAFDRESFVKKYGDGR